MSKTLLITGISPSSVGLSTLQHILTQNALKPHPITYHLLLAQRDPTSPHSISAVQTLQTLTRTATITNSPTPSSQQHRISVLKCDLANLQSVREAAEQIKAQAEQVDTAILNAGAVFKDRRLVTDDRIERSLVVNHLGHFLLLSLLKDMISERVVFVSSSLHRKADLGILTRRLQRGEGEEDVTYDSMKFYAQSKLLQILCLKQWARIFAGGKVQVLAVSPGFVPSSGLSRESGWVGVWAMKWVMHYAPFARSLEQAGGSVGGVVLGDVGVGGSGVYVGANGKVEDVHVGEGDEGTRRIAWEWSCEHAGVDVASQ